MVFMAIYTYRASTDIPVVRGPGGGLDVWEIQEAVRQYDVKRQLATSKWVGVETTVTGNSHK